MSENNGQLELIPVVSVSGKGKTKSEQFAEFHRENPHVYRNLVKLAQKMAAMGRKRTGICLLYENLRWEFYIHTKVDETDFRLPNDYKPFYARLIMRDNPELADIFETREMKGELVGV